MNAYPVNLIPGAALSGNTLSFSDIRNVYHRYMKHRAWFPGVNAVIAMEWKEPLRMDSFIIADTDYVSMDLTVTFFDNSVIDFHKDLLEDGMEIIEWDDNKPVKKINLYLYRQKGVNEHYLGYLFAGEKVTLPRFLVEPQWETEIRGSANRTNNGQVYGTILPTLDKFAVEFARVYKDEKKVIDRYIRTVHNSIPHVVDLYPEAREDFPPRYVTLDSGVAFTKRNEADFWWNFNMEWMEAR